MSGSFASNNFTPTGNISATTLAGAITELESEVVHLTGAETISGVKTLSDTTTATSSSTGALKLPGIGMGNGAIYLSSPSTSDNSSRVVTSAFVNNYISRGTDSNSKNYIRFGNSSGSGLLIKFGSDVVTISSNSGSFSISGTPAFNAAPTVILCNGDSSAADSSANVTNASVTASTIAFKTPSFASGSYRVNWIAFGTPA